MDAVAPSCVAQRTVAVLENRAVARDTYRIRLDDPEMARAILPGQFLMIRPAAGTDPLLGRPFALYDVARSADGSPAAIDVVYLVLGRGTAALAERRPGDRVTVWGPLGNGFGPAPAGPVVFVAGGIGQTPFLALGRWWLGRAAYGADRIHHQEPATSATLLYGVRTSALAAGVGDFESAGIAVELATDDGSAGHHGFVTDLLARRLERGERPAKVVGCGPPPMLAALARLAARHDVPCDLSLENHMSCGFGACFSCVAPIRQPDGSVDLRRVCVEGPIFPANDVVWPQT
ncbi:MAG: dihydroorotate dehydrogenase electron transfer subunit [Isosphaeraceae bacterium]|nr:dihydroorotate dehydrogenase electron transfer subunit [Isosphaeraceae bacterium]